jgi:hypothetical protein
VFQIAVAGCLVTLVAGCGSSSTKTPAVAASSSSDAPSTPSASSGSPTASPSATTSEAPADLDEIVLKASDLPAGWKGTAYHAHPGDDANQAALLKCVGARNTGPDKVAEANSDDFALGDASVSSSATRYRSRSDLDVDVAVLHSPKLSTCYERLIGTKIGGSLPAGTKINSKSFKITLGSAGGPSNIIATGTSTIDLTVDGQAASVYLTISFITGPLIQAEVDTENIGSPMPASLVTSLVTAVAKRAGQG